MTTGKTIALTRRIFVGKVMSLLFNMLSRLVINFLPKSKHLLISELQSPSALILEPQKIKSLFPTSQAGTGMNYPRSEVRGHGQEEQPNLQGAVAAQQGLEELLYVQCQEGWR